MARRSDPVHMSSYARTAARSLGRLANTDTEALAALAALQAEVAELLAGAVAAQLDDGCSWAEVADATGISRQLAMHRWGKVARSRRPAGAQPAAVR